MKTRQSVEKRVSMLSLIHADVSPENALGQATLVYMAEEVQFTVQPTYPASKVTYKSHISARQHLFRPSAFPLEFGHPLSAPNSRWSVTVAHNP